MKNFFKLAALLFLTVSCKAQVTSTVPLGTSYTYIQPGMYFKDLDNELSYWEGTWVGVLNNKQYTFIFQKFLEQPRVDFDSNIFYKDELKGKFKVVDLITNTVLYDNLSATTYEEYKIRGIIINFNTDFTFTYHDTEANCRNGAEFHLQKTTVSNQIKYCYFYYTGIGVLDCVSYAEQEDIPMFLPWDDLILTKQ